ncbi:hypothetical protein BASA81_004760 [Batrachochytrium salamandrivorans]|nr:hypothetical protein BASA81_004760 [Batrachochytrium salamandrivorans]
MAKWFCCCRAGKHVKEHEVLRLGEGRFQLTPPLQGQFQHFTNLYFLIIFIIAVLGDNQVSGLNWFQSPYDYSGFLTSLSIVVAIGVVFDLGYDINRHREDWKVNGHKAMKFLPDGTTQTCNWDALLPGDFVLVNKEEQFPCDLVFLRANRNPEFDQEDFDPERCYVETSNVDGETNLKLRLTPDPLPPSAESNDNFYEVLRGFELSYDLPKPKLEFSGLLYQTTNSTNPLVKTTVSSIPSPDQDLESTPLSTTPPLLRTPLTFKNILLRGSILKNTHSVVGLVVYAGRETKGVLSSSETKSKISNAMKLVNKAILSILFVGLVMVLVSAGVSTTMTTDQWYLGNPPPYVFGAFWSSFFTFVILYSNLLPISLVIATTITNFIQAVFVNWDSDIPGSKCRTLELAQEIGQVSFVFSDKTGTLTRNEMKFVRCAVFGVDGIEDDVEGGEAKNSDLPIPDLFPGLLQRREDSEQVREFLLAISLCHTVLVEGDEYNAEGPDEEALVGGVAQLGYRLAKTGRSGYEVESAYFPRQLDSGICKFDILAINAFDSTRKRMSSIIRFPDGSIDIYVKGADSIMLGLLQEEEIDLPQTKRLYSDLDAFALEGLRTLVYARRSITEEEWIACEMEMIQANDLLGMDKDLALNAVAAKMENNLQLLGASAIEDRLQEGVPETLKCFRDAGIKTWVLTGDKVETAINIGYSSGLLTKDMKVIEVCGTDVEENDKAIYSLGLAIDPKQLAKIELQAKRRKSTTTAYNSRNSGHGGVGPLASFSMPTPTNRSSNANTVSFNAEQINGEDPYEMAKQTKLLLSNGFHDLIKTRKAVARKLSVPALSRRGSAANRQSTTQTNPDQLALHQHSETDTSMISPPPMTSSGHNVTFLDTTLEFNTTMDNTVVFDHTGALEDTIMLNQTIDNGTTTTTGSSSNGEFTDPFLDMNDEENVEAASLALVVDGGALHGILHDCKELNNKAPDDPLFPSTERELKFLAVAKVCKVVIACRVSPRQKALLVRLVRKGVRMGGKEPITLAVGDGANDVGMIQESRVGVGIAGREGSQAVNNADFAIHQFRYLRKLLLVHGRWNYRRISFLVLFIFYAHILPVIISFGYNFTNLWSGTTPYPFVWVVAYSYLVVIPAIFIAAFNRDISVETAIKFPSIYVSGRANLSMGRFKITEYILKAGVHATILCVMLYLVFPQPVLSYYDLGTTVYWCILLTVLGRLAFECFTWTIVSAVVFFICLIIFPIIEVIMYNSSIEFSGTVLFGPWANWVWATAAITASMCIILDMLASLVRRHLFPNLIDFVIEADRQKDGVLGIAPLVAVLNVFSRPRELDRQAVLQSVRDHRADIPIMPQSRSGFAHDVVEGGEGGNGVGGSKSHFNFSSMKKVLKHLPGSRPSSSTHRNGSSKRTFSQDDLPIAINSAEQEEAPPRSHSPFVVYNSNQ